MLNGEQFPLGKVTVSVERPPNRMPIVLGEVEVNSFGKWSLNFVADEDLTTSLDDLTAGNSNPKSLLIYVTYDRNGISQRIPICQ